MEGLSETAKGSSAEERLDPKSNVPYSNPGVAT